MYLTRTLFFVHAHKIITESTPIKRWCSIKFCELLTANSNHFLLFLSKNNLILDKKRAKVNNVCSKCTLWRFIQAFYRHGYGYLKKSLFFVHPQKNQSKENFGVFFAYTKNNQYKEKFVFCACTKNDVLTKILFFCMHRKQSI